MVLALSIVLLVNAAFAFTVWPAFMRRIAADGERTRFYRVHLVLISSALGLAAVSLIAGAAGLWSLAAP
ncbi:MAG: SCO4848 family membrane protein [Demequina sp.]